jgi:hypothetical protein
MQHQPLLQFGFHRFRENPKATYVMYPTDTEDDCKQMPVQVLLKSQQTMQW